MTLKQKKILLVSNITDHSGPTEGLARFLQRESDLLVVIYHPFFYCQDRRSKARLFVKGRKKREFITFQLSLPEFVKYFVDLLFTFYFTFRFRRKFDIFIGVNSFHSLVGFFYKKLGLVDKVIFYTIDWVPQRFPNKFFNKLYFWVDSFSRTNADYLWNLSEEITQIREKQGVNKKKQGFSLNKQSFSLNKQSFSLNKQSFSLNKQGFSANKNFLVPNGVNFDEIKRVPIGKIERYTLALVGALHESKGVDLIIGAMPKIWQEFPQVKLVVIGMTPKVSGIKPYEEIFRSMGERVSFLGTLPHEKILSILPKLGIGLSPYSPEVDNLSRFAWPARVIDYLACGLPVIITPVPSVAWEIEKEKAGVLIDYSQEDLVRAVGKLLTDDKFYYAARGNAVRLVRHLSWDNIFKKAFSQMKNDR